MVSHYNFQKFYELSGMIPVLLGEENDIKSMKVFPVQ